MHKEYKELAHLENSRKDHNVTIVFVIFSSISPKITDLFFKGLPGRKCGYSGRIFATIIAAYLGQDTSQ